MSPRVTHTVPGGYQYIALHKGNRVQRFWHEHKMKLIKLISPTCGGEIMLDVGCGSGNFVFEFALECRSVYGVDILKDGVSFAHRIANKSGVKNTHYIQASAQHIPFLDSSVDRILLLDVIEHLRKPQEAFVELARILKPKGKAIVTTPNAMSLWPIIEYVADILKIGICRRFVEHESTYTATGLIRAIRRSDLLVVKIGSTYFLSPIAAIFSRRVGRKLFEMEIVQRNPFGMLLYCIVEKQM